MVGPTRDRVLRGSQETSMAAADAGALPGFLDARQSLT